MCSVELVPNALRQFFGRSPSGDGNEQPFVPASDGGGDVVHSLDLLHDPDRDSSREVRD